MGKQEADRIVDQYLQVSVPPKNENKRSSSDNIPLHFYKSNG